jgi:hypothetical protein
MPSHQLLMQVMPSQEFQSMLPVFAAYSDERLKQTMDHERKVCGWGSERSYFLAALRGECEKRGIDYCWK